MKVYEFMTTKMEFVESTDSVYDIIERMVDRRIRSLVVRFPGRQRDYGVITSRDIVFKVLAKGLDPQLVRASEIASRPVVCIDKEMGFQEVTELMQESNIARLFVCDGDRVVGFVSLYDVMAAALILRARG